MRDRAEAEAGRERGLDRQGEEQPERTDDRRAENDRTEASTVAASVVGHGEEDGSSRGENEPTYMRPRAKFPATFHLLSLPELSNDDTRPALAAVPLPTVNVKAPLTGCESAEMTRHVTT